MLSKERPKPRILLTAWAYRIKKSGLVAAFALDSRIHLQEGIMKRSKSAVLTVTVAPLIDRNGGVGGSVAFKF